MSAVAAELHFEPGPHRYTVGGHVLPSVTQICKQIGDSYAGIPNDVLEAARDRGDAVHYATELYDRGELDEDSVPAVIVPYLAAYKKFCEETGFLPIQIELKVWHPMYRYAGTLDRVGRFTRLAKIRPTWNNLIDFKATYTVLPQTQVQTALYAAAYDYGRPKQEQIHRRWGLQLRPDGTYRLTMFDEPSDFGVGLAAKTLHEWRARHAL